MMAVKQRRGGVAVELLVLLLAVTVVLVGPRWRPPSPFTVIPCRMVVVVVVMMVMVVRQRSGWG